MAAVQSVPNLRVQNFPIRLQDPHLNWVLGAPPMNTLMLTYMLYAVSWPSSTSLGGVRPPSQYQFVFLADETFANEKNTSADETLSANERLSETFQNLSLAITLSLAVAKTVGMLNCSPNSLHSANERF